MNLARECQSEFQGRTGWTQVSGEEKFRCRCRDRSERPVRCLRLCVNPDIGIIQFLISEFMKVIPSYTRFPP